MEHGGAFIDLNMDCRADLLVESITQYGRTHEIYMYSDKGFCYTGSKAVPQEYSLVSFLDLSQRGSNDAVFITKDMVMHIFRNKFSLGVEG